MGNGFGESHFLGMNLQSCASSFWTGTQERPGEQDQQDHTTGSQCPQRGFGLAGPQGPSPLHAGTQQDFPGKLQHPNYVLPATLPCGSSSHHPPPPTLVHVSAGWCGPGWGGSFSQLEWSFLPAGATSLHFPKDAVESLKTTGSEARDCEVPRDLQGLERAISVAEMIIALIITVAS